MNDFVISLIRTIVPIGVGYAVTLLAGLGVDLDQGALTGALVGFLSAVYYALARWLETRFPQLRFLLGASKAPTYN